jgi:hypothetical protein
MWLQPFKNNEHIRMTQVLFPTLQHHLGEGQQCALNLSNIPDTLFSRGFENYISAVRCELRKMTGVGIEFLECLHPDHQHHLGEHL